MLTKKFTRREKVLLTLLAAVMLLGLYFILVQYPISTRMDALEAQRQSLELDLELAQERLQKYEAMRSELDEIFSLPEDEITVMPAYDNIEQLMIRFDAIFAGMEPQLSFERVSTDGGVAVRPVRFTFTASDYQAARDILTRLTGTGWRCLMDGVSIVPSGDGARTVAGGAVTVSGTITFYETMNG